MTVKSAIGAGPLHAALIGLLLALGSSSGCNACESRPAVLPLATLQAMTGATAQRDFAPRSGQWLEAKLGANFAVGDGVRTAAHSAAMLGLGDGSTLHVRESTTIRFLVDGANSDEHALDVSTGDALLITGQHELRLRTHVGLAVLAPGTEVLLKREGQGLELRVDIGDVRFRDSAGEAIDVKAGESIQVGIGMAVLHRTFPATPPAALPPAAAPVAADEVAKEARPDIEPSEPASSAANSSPKGEPMAVGPTYSNLGVPAGESFTIHASEVPVAVSFAFGGRCPREGEVELVGANQRSRGQGSANLLLAPGTRNYVVRCVDDNGVLQRKPAARGSVRVLRDAGTNKLPPRAPSSLVDADGRSYTVYYQNQLPEVHVRWPNAPHAASYHLTVDDKSLSTPAPEYLFRSGSLPDGVHQVSFYAADRRSRATAIEIRFDNAAPKASLSAPADRGFRAGQTVKVEGVALPTWKVSVQGGTITKDDNDRFFGEVATSEERPNIAVRLTHPRLGTHYYLRRAIASP